MCRQLTFHQICKMLLFMQRIMSPFRVFTFQGDKSQNFIIKLHVTSRYYIIALYLQTSHTLWSLVAISPMIIPSSSDIIFCFRLVSLYTCNTRLVTCMSNQQVTPSVPFNYSCDLTANFNNKGTSQCLVITWKLMRYCLPAFIFTQVHYLFLPI